MTSIQNHSKQIIWRFLNGICNEGHSRVIPMKAKSPPKAKKLPLSLEAGPGPSSRVNTRLLDTRPDTLDTRPDTRQSLEAGPSSRVNTRLGASSLTLFPKSLASLNSSAKAHQEAHEESDDDSDEEYDEEDEEDTSRHYSRRETLQRQQLVRLIS